MIPSYSSKDLIQYKGCLKVTCPDLDNANKIKVVDRKTHTVLFDSQVKLHNKVDWSSNGYSQEDINLI
jgi:hypothetical protein